MNSGFIRGKCGSGIAARSAERRRETGRDGKHSRDIGRRSSAKRSGWIKADATESESRGGKCADLNALYVGLARAAGLPARDVYGIRVAKSELGYKSLGAASENITKAQHCRAEVYIGGYGWVPVDPADVRKVVLEEPPGNRTSHDQVVEQARARLFGSWDWIAYNFAHDVALPGSTDAPLGFLMYPQAETSQGRIDCLDPENFHYEITSREIPSTAR